MDEVRDVILTAASNTDGFIETQKKELPLQLHQPTKCELHCYVISAISEVNDE